MGSKRRNRDLDIALGVTQLVALVFLSALFIPGIRQFFLNFMVIIGGIFLLTVAVAVIIAIVRRHHATVDERSLIFPKPDKLEVDSDISKSDSVNSTVNLVDQLRSIDWFQFEGIVALTYKKLGYSVNLRGGANPDGGIDLVIEKEGRQKAVQCKHWKTWNVGVKTVREFLGALTDAKISSGIFVTLGEYTNEAKLLANKHQIETLNESQLAKMLESVDAKSDPEILALLNDKRKRCPKCEQEMVLKTARKGLSSGKQFWGCSAFPKCRFTMPA
jgi:restriction system protein